MHYKIGYKLTSGRGSDFIRVFQAIYGTQMFPLFSLIYITVNYSKMNFFIFIKIDKLYKKYSIFLLTMIIKIFLSNRN